MHGPKNHNPLVSVIVTIYNLEPYLRECLTSLVCQTYTNLEIVAIDDGSTDSSADIIREFAASDSRIRLISKPNEGISLTRRRGAEESQGEYVFWIDGDDYIQPDYIMRLMEAMQMNKCNSACGERMKVWGARGVLLQPHSQVFYSPGQLISGLLLERLFASVADKIYSRSLLDDLEWFADVNMWEDFLINVQVALKPEFKGLCIVPDAYYYYVQRPGSLMKKRLDYGFIEKFIGYSESLFRSCGDGGLYSVERAANMVLRHYVYVRILSNRWRGHDDLSKTIRDKVRDNGKSMKDMVPWMIRQATLLYPYRAWFFLVKILVTLNKWRDSFSKHSGNATANYTIPAPGENKQPKVLKKS